MLLELSHLQHLFKLSQYKVGAENEKLLFDCN